MPYVFLIERLCVPANVPASELAANESAEIGPFIYLSGHGLTVQ